uniref:LITAF domain-containing protein n=1 Tax=Onchocerca volvulus TaxID=6282 RepID=A0A8R1TYM2_ONCVO
MIGRHLTTLDKITIGIDNIERIKYLKIFVQQLQRMENVIREQISSPPPPYSPLSGYEAKSTMIQSSRYQEPVESLQQSQCPLSPCFQKRDFPPEINPSTHSSIEPIIMPIVMPQTTVVPPYSCQPMSDKPVNVIVNGNNNNRAEENSLAKDYRICIFCKRGIMEKKKDWLRVIAILFVSMLCPPFSLLCCFFLCTRVIYFGECSACHRISKRERRIF